MRRIAGAIVLHRPRRGPVRGEHRTRQRLPRNRSRAPRISRRPGFGSGLEPDLAGSAFRDWSIEREIETIACPLLAVQGLDDQYGTLEQIHGLARRVPQTELIELADCGHSPHRDQPEKLIAASTEFLARHRGAWPGTAR
jgi:pimeloyl-ACP methyl ester carboxylesterase